MNRNALIATVILLLIGAGALVVQRGGSSRISDQPPRDNPSKSATPAQAPGSKSQRDQQRPATAEQAAKRLRQLVRAGPNQAPGFSHVENLASQLSDADLAALRTETASAPADSLGAWVRCAVFAELARRNPQAAMAFLKNDPSLYQYGEWPLRQAWFSTFRGWAEIDPAAAAEELAKYTSPRNLSGRVISAGDIQNQQDYKLFISRDDRWRQQAILAVFAAYARKDPEAAWAAVTEQEDISGMRKAALEGLFRGVEGEENVQLLLDHWPPAELAREVELRIESMQVMSEIRLADPNQRSTFEAISVQAAAAMERATPGSGQDWYFSGKFPSGADPQDIHMGLYDNLARTDPDRAISLLERGGNRNWTLLASLLRHHPNRASEGFAAAREPIDPYFEALHSIHGQSSLRLEDLFPAPGRSNQLPDWDQRYHDLLGVVEAGGFSAEQQDALRLEIRQEFLPVIPD